MKFIKCDNGNLINLDMIEAIELNPTEWLRKEKWEIEAYCGDGTMWLITEPKDFEKTKYLYDKLYESLKDMVIFDPLAELEKRAITDAD